MKNKIVGIMIVIMAAVIGAVTWMFNHALTSIVDTSCTHGPACPMYGEINFQTYLSIVIIAIIAIIGLYLIFFGEDRVEVIKKIRIKGNLPKKDHSKVLKTLTSEEKKIFNLVSESQGAIFQSDLNEKSGFDKVKVTRILDRLEGQGIIERRRRGMTNIVLLK